MFTHVNKIAFMFVPNKKVKEITTKHAKNRGKRHTSRTHETLNQREYAIMEYRNYFLLVDNMDASLVTVLPDLLLAISGLLNFRNICLSLEKWKPQTKSLVRQATRKQPLTVVKCHRVCESRSSPDSRSASPLTLLTLDSGKITTAL